MTPMPAPAPMARAVATLCIPAVLSTAATTSVLAAPRPAARAPTPRPAARAPRVYPAPAGLAPSPEFRVFVDGREVFVHDNPAAALAAFDMGDGPVSVEIRPRRDAKWVDVRPLSRGVRARVEDGNVVRLTLDRPGNFSVEINRDLRRPLFLFANPPEENRPDPADPAVVFFAAGKVYDLVDQPIASGQTVYIEGGAVVRGTLTAKGARGIRIAGRGVLDGTGLNQRPAGRRSRLVELRDSADITVEDVILSNGVSWQLVPINSERLRVRNLKIVSDNGGDDGIDLVRSRDVVVDGVFVRTKDDCIAVKTNFDYPPEAGTENVLVKNGVFWNAAWGNALEIGFELRSTFVRNLRFVDSDILHVESGAVLSIHNGDTATVQDVTFENLRIEDARQKLFDVAIFYTQYSVDQPADRQERERRYLHGAWDGVLALAPEEVAAHAAFRGHVRDVRFRDIHVVDGSLPYSLFWGYDAGHTIDGVTIENLTFHGRPLRSLAEARVVTNAHVRNLRWRTGRAR